MILKTWGDEMGILKCAYKVSRMFPQGCKTGNELDWMLKGNCPACVKAPFEPLSVFDYRMKYPAHNTITIGSVKLNLCDRHLRQLRGIIDSVVDKKELNL